MAWFYLILGGLFEIVWAIALKYSENFSKLVPSIITLVAMALSFDFLSRAMKTIPIGVAYAIWTSIGAVGVAIVGVIIFKESLSLLKFVSIGLIIAGIIGLKLSN